MYHSRPRHPLLTPFPLTVAAIAMLLVVVTYALAALQV